MVGLTRVEVLRETATGFAAEVVAAPSALVDAASVGEGACKENPVVIATTDADGDSLDDILVFDSCIGPWVAIQRAGAFNARLWADVLPALPLDHFLESIDLDGGDRLLVSADTPEVFGTRWRTIRGVWSNSQGVPLPQPTLATSVTQMLLPFVGDSGNELILQGQRQLVALPFGQSEEAFSGPPTVLQQVLSMPYLAPFDAFDQLQPLRVPGCGPQAVGVALLPKGSGGASERHLEWISFGESTYDPVDLDESLQPVGVAVVQRADEGDTLVMVLGERGQSDMHASLWVVAGCDGPVLVAEAPVEFAFRTPRSPLGYDNKYVPKTDGLKFVTVWNAQSRTFRSVHYDGFDVRVFLATEESGQWSLVEKKISIHTNRGDLAY